MKRHRDIKSFFKKRKVSSESATGASSREKAQSGQQHRHSSSDEEEQSAPSALHGEGTSTSLSQPQVCEVPLSNHGTSGESDSYGVSEDDAEMDDPEFLSSAKIDAAPPGPYDISQSRGTGPTQPQLKVFPRTLQGNRKRCFSSQWYKLYSWLEYSQSQDSAYCFACRHFSLPNTTASVFTSPLGFCHWKKAMFKDSGFKLHEKSEGHINAMFAWGEHKKMVLTNSSMRDAINEAYNKKVQENRKYITTVAEVLLLTATQNIAQRGHRETEEVNNKGNFLEMLELIAKHDPIVQKKLKGRQNATYTSAVIQNEILECLANMVREDIIDEVKQSEVFSVIADETKDLKKKEQLSLVLRYYYNGAVHESFLDFQQATRLDAEGVKEKLVQCLEKYGLEYRSSLVGQGYDGASVMSGKHCGVAARIKAEAKHAVYIHCNAHCLNLVLVDAVKAIPEANCFFSLLQKIYTYMSGSYVHQKWLDVQKEMYKDQPRELQKLSDTRWACRYIACKNLMDRLPAVLHVLHEIAAEDSGERSVDARGLLSQLDLSFVSLLATFRKLLGDAKLLSDTLQSPCLDLSMAVNLVHALKDSLQDYRSETFVHSLWEDIVETATKCSLTTENAGKKRSQKLSSRLGRSVVMSTLGQYKCSSGDEDIFRRTIFYPIVDTILGELDKRFSKDNCDIMRGIQALDPKSTSFLEDEVLFRFGGFYESDLEDLRHELHQTKRLLQRKEQSGMQTLSGIVDFAVFLEPHKDIFHELFRLCKIAIAVPVSTAACERSFSALKLIKTHLRTTMSDNRLSNLGVLSIEARRAKTLHMDRFIKVFASHHKNRRIHLF